MLCFPIVTANSLKLYFNSDSKYTKYVTRFNVSVAYLGTTIHSILKSVHGDLRTNFL